MSKELWSCADITLGEAGAEEHTGSEHTVPLRRPRIDAYDKVVLSRYFSKYEKNINGRRQRSMRRMMAFSSLSERGWIVSLGPLAKLFSSSVGGDELVLSEADMSDDCAEPTDSLLGRCE